MTIEQSIKEKGWIMEVAELKRFQSVAVAFMMFSARKAG